MVVDEAGDGMSEQNRLLQDGRLDLYRRWPSHGSHRDEALFSRIDGDPFALAVAEDSDATLFSPLGRPELGHGTPRC